ncbi:DUF6221 family protein [Sphaerisporangium sp. NPDC051011]|uniref:DUF6221 family protein n=1 Tax=Sphaerisporangium sp. NPDC051011 TaxID=3155792 RepID=UPI0033EB3702
MVGSAWPRWHYIVAFDSGRLDDELHRPDEHETQQLRSFLNEDIHHWYNDRWKAKLAERPFDIRGAGGPMSTDTDAFVSFLKARLAEDEAAANATGNLRGPTPTGYRVFGVPGKLAYSTGRLLREVEARQWILARFEYRLTMQPDDAQGPEHWDDLTRHHYETLCDLAASYLTHPGYAAALGKLEARCPCGTDPCEWREICETPEEVADAIAAHLWNTRRRDLVQSEPAPPRMAEW